jgi:hypothetical protein
MKAQRARAARIKAIQRGDASRPLVAADGSET